MQFLPKFQLQLSEKKKLFKICMEAQKILNSQKKKKAGGTIPHFKLNKSSKTDTWANETKLRAQK